VSARLWRSRTRLSHPAPLPAWVRAQLHSRQAALKEATEQLPKLGANKTSEGKVSKAMLKLSKLPTLEQVRALVHGGRMEGAWRLHGASMQRNACFRRHADGSPFLALHPPKSCPWSHMRRRPVYYAVAP
jgi:hypothetical protein